MDLQIKVKGEVPEKMQIAAKILYEELLEKTKHWTEVVKEEAQRRAPRFRGGLKRSIKGKVKETPYGFKGIVGTTKWYAHFVEGGTTEHFVPFAKAPNLVRWLKKHGTTIQETSTPGMFDVYVRGTTTLLARSVTGMKISAKAHPFIKPAYDAHISDIIRDFNNLPEEVIEKVGLE
ncbi:MAG: HK97 gp10 family phage protein [Thermoanaerobacteraceae bacterium]|nr:HK97 gp10 family phage protein [Thermoanaerobacteraceae bacterium]